MFFDALAQLLGLVCVAGFMAFFVLLLAAILRNWLERLAQIAADAAED